MSRESNTPGRRNPGRFAAIGGNVLSLSLISFLNDAASEVIYPLLPLFVTVTLGAGPAFLGVIEGAAESASSLLKLAGGAISDRFHRRKLLIGWGYGIAAVVRPIIAIATAPWHILAVRLADRVGKGIRTAPRDALLVESVPADRRGLAFGFHRGADHAGAVVGPLFATAFLLLFPGALRPLFATTILPGALAVLVLLLRVRERAPGGGMPASATAAPAPAPAPAPAAAAAAVRTAAATAPDEDGRRAEPGYGRYLAAIVVFTLGNASDAFLLLRARQLGVAVALLPLLWAAFHVSKMSWSVPGGLLADRAGPRPAILAGWFVYAAVYAGFAWASTEWQIWGLFLVYGLFYGLTEAPEKTLVAAFARARHRGFAFGAYHFAVGIAALPASVVFGLLWQRVGPHVAFLYGASLAFAAGALLVLIVPTPPPTAAA